VLFKNKKIGKSSKIKTVKPAKEKKGIFKVLAKISDYFKGSWQELKLVRWPDRKSTWSMTLAVILFTAFFVALIILLDMGFQELLNLIIK
jgi:preprotein translocase SecE subunit